MKIMYRCLLCCTEISIDVRFIESTFHSSTKTETMLLVNYLLMVVRLVVCVNSSVLALLYCVEQNSNPVFKLMM